MNFQEFMNWAWAEHGKSSETVAAKVADALSLIQENSQIVSFANFATHLFGEHLKKYREGVALLKELRLLPCFVKESESDKAVERFIASLELLSGKNPSPHFSKADLARIYAIAASAWSGQRQGEKATSAFKTALHHANTGLEKNDPANRALAVASNNLAATLEEVSERSDADNSLMILAAETAREYWAIAGGWLEVERAEYRLAMSCLKAGQLERALQHAQNCLEFSKRNNADALEIFFAYEAIASVEKAQGKNFHAALDLMKSYFEKLSVDDKTWCEESLLKFS